LSALLLLIAYLLTYQELDYAVCLCPKFPVTSIYDLSGVVNCLFHVFDFATSPLERVFVGGPTFWNALWQPLRLLKPVNPLTPTVAIWGLQL